MSYQSLGIEPDDNTIENVKKYNVKDEVAFDSLDKRAAGNIFKIEFAKDVMKTVVDGSGNYFIKVKPGTYYVYIQSNNRKGASMTEVLGKIKCQKVIVKEGEDTNMSCNFGL